MASEHTNDRTPENRRYFLKAAALGAFSLGAAPCADFQRALGEDSPLVPSVEQTPEGEMGTIYPLLKRLAERSEFEMSFLRDRFDDVEAWKSEGRRTVLEHLHYDPPEVDPAPDVVERVEREHYVREKLYFSTGPGVRVPAYLLIPKGYKGPRPAIVNLHDHGGFFVWGKEKLTENEDEHPALREFKDRYYAGRSVASELAKRGYVVITIDTFYWGERRMLLAEDPPKWWRRERLSTDEVWEFNRRSNNKTWQVGVALNKAGMTWAGLMILDDIRTVDYLASRPEVDADRIGCCGLSVGGFRSAHLAGLDPRIKTGVVVGWMCAYGHMLQAHVHSIGPMKAIPGLYRYMDLPDIVSMAAPNPLMVIHGRRDGLFPMDGVEVAFEKIGGVYDKAGAGDRFRSIVYDGPHEFNARMQREAFAWLDEGLKA